LALVIRPQRSLLALRQAELWRYRPRFPWTWWLLYPYRWMDIAGDILKSSWLAVTQRYKVLNNIQ
jgi:hypothetical protein